MRLGDEAVASSRRDEREEFGMDMDKEVIVVRPEEMLESRFAGVVRWQAFENPYTPVGDDLVWAGRTRNEPGEKSNWHVHPNHVTYGYEITGTLRVEFGPGGRKIVEAGAGSFVRVPAGLVHRESSVGTETRNGIGIRIGSGPYVVEVDGPEPEE
jgi:uncharacterized RmlC-like cupin family protein